MWDPMGSTNTGKKDNFSKKKKTQMSLIDVEKYIILIKLFIRLVQCDIWYF